MYLQNIVCVAPVLHSQIVRTNIVTNIDTHTNTQGENIITSLTRVIMNGSGVWDMASSWMFSRGCFTATPCHCDWQIYVYIVWFFTSSALWSLVTFSTEFPRVFRRHWQSACTAPGNIKLMPAVSDVQGNCEYVYGHRMLGIQAWALTWKVSVHSKHCSNWVW